MGQQDLRMQIKSLRDRMVKLEKRAKEREDVLTKVVLMLEPFLEVFTEAQKQEVMKMLEENKQ